jgi:hypothetical protein
MLYGGDGMWLTVSGAVRLPQKTQNGCSDISLSRIVIAPLSRRMVTATWLMIR